MCVVAISQSLHVFAHANLFGADQQFMKIRTRTHPHVCIWTYIPLSIPPFPHLCQILPSRRVPFFPDSRVFALPFSRPLQLPLPAPRRLALPRQSPLPKQSQMRHRWQSLEPTLLKPRWRPMVDFSSRSLHSVLPLTLQARLLLSPAPPGGLARNAPSTLPAEE